MKQYFLNEKGALEIGGLAGDELTPSNLFDCWASEDEKGFTSNSEETAKGKLDAHCFLTIDEYEVTEK
jgi:hypothetical protein